MKCFLLDTHVHTSEVSRCANTTARRMVQLYKAAGFDGIVITDHLSRQFNKSGLRDDWPLGAEAFLQGYFSALEEGQRVGLRVYCGMELNLNCTWPNDYLVFGLTPEIIHREGPFYHLAPSKFKHLARANGLLIYQAHPFRQGWNYSPLTGGVLDGIEVFNANIRHDSRNPVALAYAQAQGLLQSAGSDAHEEEDVGRCGMVLAREPRDERELVDLLPSAELKT